MSNVTFNAIASAPNSDSGFNASDVWGAAGNFNNISAVVENLDSDNFGTGTDGFGSEHIGIGAVVGSHISANQINSIKVSAGAVQQAAMEFKSASDGVRVLQIGGGVLPTNGVACVRVSKAVTFSDNTDLTNVLSMVYSDGVDGKASFTDTPVAGGLPVLIASATNFGQILDARITYMNSNACYIVISHGGVSYATPVAFTAHMDFIGARTGG